MRVTVFLVSATGRKTVVVGENSGHLEVYSFLKGFSDTRISRKLGAKQYKVTPRVGVQALWGSYIPG